MEYKNRVLTVDGLVVREGKVLLVKRGRDPYKGYWALPGGYMDHDETIPEAVVREVNEETGLRVTEAKLMKIYDDPDRHPDQTISAAYICMAEGEPIAADDAEECEWFDLNDLPEQIAFDHAKMIADYKKQNA